MTRPLSALRMGSIRPLVKEDKVEVGNESSDLKQLMLV